MLEIEDIQFFERASVFDPSARDLFGTVRISGVATITDNSIGAEDRFKRVILRMIMHKVYKDLPEILEEAMYRLRRSDSDSVETRVLIERIENVLSKIDV